MKLLKSVAEPPDSRPTDPSDGLSRKVGLLLFDNV